jgi:hypothetical protein
MRIEAKKPKSSLKSPIRCFDVAVDSPQKACVMLLHTMYLLGIFLTSQFCTKVLIVAECGRTCEYFTGAIGGLGHGKMSLLLLDMMMVLCGSPRLLECFCYWLLVLLLSMMGRSW